MTSRAVVEVTVLKVATRKESMLKRAKAKARVETTEGTDEVTRTIPQFRDESKRE